MKVPTKKQGNGVAEPHLAVSSDASMKALPKRKGPKGREMGFCVMLASRGPVPQ